MTGGAIALYTLIYKVVLTNLKKTLVFLNPGEFLALNEANYQLNLDLGQYNEIEASIVYSSKPESDKDIIEPLDKGKGKEIEDTSDTEDTPMDLDSDSGSDVDMGEPLDKGKGKEVEDTSSTEDANMKDNSESDNKPLDKGKGKETEDSEMKDDSGSDVSSDEGLDEDIIDLLKELKNSVQTDNVKRQIKSLEKLLTGDIEQKVPTPPKPPVPDFWGHGWYDTPKPVKPPVPDHWGHGWYGPSNSSNDEKPVENTNEGSNLVPLQGNASTSSPANPTQNPTQKPLNTGNTEKTSEIRGIEENIAETTQTINQEDREDTGREPGNESNTDGTSKNPESKGNASEVTDSKTNENINDIPNNKTIYTDMVSENRTGNTYEVSDSYVIIDNLDDIEITLIFDPDSKVPKEPKEPPMEDYLGEMVDIEIWPYMEDFYDLFSYFM